MENPEYWQGVSSKSLAKRFETCSLLSWHFNVRCIQTVTLRFSLTAVIWAVALSIVAALCILYSMRDLICDINYCVLAVKLWYGSILL